MPHEISETTRYIQEEARREKENNIINTDTSTATTNKNQKQPETEIEKNDSNPLKWQLSVFNTGKFEKHSATHYNIPENITYNGELYEVNSIGKKTFYHYYNLESISIPPSITEVSDGAFAGCNKLTLLNWNAKLDLTPEIIEQIKKDCPNLKEINYRGEIIAFAKTKDPKMIFSIDKNISKDTKTITIPIEAKEININSFIDLKELNEIIWESNTRLSKETINLLSNICPKLEQINYHGKIIEICPKDIDTLIQEGKINSFKEDKVQEKNILKHNETTTKEK